MNSHLVNELSMPDHFPVTAHTDFVSEGGIFVVIQGFKQDGLAYVPLAIEKGARTIVIHHQVTIPDHIYAPIRKHKVRVVTVDDPRLALAQLSAQAAGFPSCKLRIIGVTGTKGKTTTSFLLHHMMQHAGVPTALLSTVYNRIGDAIFKAPLTTAQPDYLHQFFKLCVQSGVTTVIMEVAAQAMTMHRVESISFDGVIFTNFSQEHAEFYASMQEYFEAKASLLRYRKTHAPAFINADDPWCMTLSEKKDIVTFGLDNTTADWHAIMRTESPNITLSCMGPGSSFDVQAPTLLGRFNAYNLLAACAMARHMGVSDERITDSLRTFTAVPGRMQRYMLPNGATCIIDYAHNPASFEQLFKVLSKMTSDLIVVFGAGGERDASKRPVMGAIAAGYAQRIILTSDNPRSEDPAEICDDIMAGISIEHRMKVIRMLDRQQAIHEAYRISLPGSIIVLLGKGPDEYQIIGSKKLFFSEAAIIRSLI